MLNFSAFPGILVGGRRIQGSLRSPRRRAHRARVSMEILILAVAGDLINRFISSVAHNYSSHKCKEDDRRRLESILLKVHSVIKEADGRHITNQGMLLQLKGLVKGFYLGYYMLDKIKFQPTGEESIEDETIAKKTLVQHARQDERVHNCFSHIFFLKEDDLKIIGILVGGCRIQCLLRSIAVASPGDLISRFISTVTQNYRNHTCKEEDRWRLERILLRMHSFVEEAERCHITNQGMLMQLKGLIEEFYLGYYMLDKIKFQPPEEEGIEDEVSHEILSFALSACNSRKRFRFADAIRKRTPIAFGSRSRANLKDVVDGLETKIADMREFVILLGSHPRLPRQPYSTYLYIENCMFGRRIEKQQVINFLVHNDSHDPCVSILPIIGPPRIGKKTLVQHACLDERVRNYFSHIFFFKEDDLNIGEPSHNSKASPGKYLFVIEFIWDVDGAAWKKIQLYLQNMACTEIKVVAIGRTEDIAKFGTTQPIWLKRLSEEEYWYYFKALAFGSMDPDENPKLASLAMQLVTEMRGGFIGANVLGGLLRANPNTQFWQSILSMTRELSQKNLSSFGAHPDDLSEGNIPFEFTRVAFVGAQVQCCLIYDLRVAGPGTELPKLTSQDIKLGADFPAEDKFDVLAWKSRIPPYCNYIVTYEKRKPRCMVGRKRKYKHKYYFD